MSAVDWHAEFETETRRRQVRPQPAWGSGGPLDPVVARSLRRFVAETDELAAEDQRQDKRLLARLLETAGPPGSRDLVMGQLITDVLAVGYCRALRDGAGDPVASDVAARVQAGLERRLRYHVDRLRRLGIRSALAWRARAALEAGGVLLGHGRALRRLGVPWFAYVTDAWARYEQALVDVHRGPVARPGPRVRTRPRGLF
jgi:hypothetical protein